MAQTTPVEVMSLPWVPDSSVRRRRGVLNFLHLAIAMFPAFEASTQMRDTREAHVLCGIGRQSRPPLAQYCRGRRLLLGGSF